MRKGACQDDRAKEKGNRRREEKDENGITQRGLTKTVSPQKLHRSKQRKGFFEKRENHGEKTVQRFEIRANMWSTENSRFCEKHIEKQPKISQNGLFSAAFWSK